VNKVSTRARKLIAGNWKMNTSMEEAVALATTVAAGASSASDLVVCPPFPWLLPVRDAISGSNVALGAQDCWSKPNGPFTGAVSTSMLAGLCQYVIVGHSERRQWFGDTDQAVREKVDAVLAGGMTPILCVGELLEVRQAGGADAHVARQIEEALGGRDAGEIQRCVVAYEPIWAIGTGVAASATDAEAMAQVIRIAMDAIAQQAGQGVRILYGGSVTPAKAAETLRQENVDGALVGGASLKAESFLAIATAAAD
jgi:triosephosphate isomerase